MASIKAPVGSTFGSLRVVDYPKDKPEIRICKCRCGMVIEVGVKQLTSGSITACRKCRPPGHCRFNDGVDCDSGDAETCLECGWNPQVATARTTKMKEDKRSIHGFYVKRYSNGI